MKRMNEQECISELTLDQLFAEELDTQTRQRVADHIAGCAACQARDRALARERDAFLARAPSFAEHARLVGAEPPVAATPGPPAVVVDLRRVARGAAGLVALAAAAWLAFVPSEPQGGGEIRRKGGAHLGLFIKHGDQVGRGQSGDVVSPGDVVRLTYTSASKAHLAVLGWDGREATVYFPDRSQAAELSAGNEIPLHFGVELDSRLGTERLLGVFCREPFEVEPLRAALGAEGKLVAPEGCEVDEVRLKKELLR